MLENKNTFRESSVLYLAPLIIMKSKVHWRIFTLFKHWNDASWGQFMNMQPVSPTYETAVCKE
jgi:hypothetical protein